MRRKFGMLSAALVFVVALNPAFAKKKKSKDETSSANVDPAQLYDKAVLKFRKKDCVAAEPMFRRIINDFPYSRFAPLSELRIADCQYRNEDFEIAIKGYQAFVQTRPAHSEVPYASFKIGQSHYKLIPEKWFMAPPAYERDQSAARDALRELREFISAYPDDDRVEHANEMIKGCITLLAKHEMSVAKFYMKRKAYRGVVGRIEDMLTNYSGSKLDAEGLYMLGYSYAKLKEPAKARAAYQRLVDEFPKSKHAKTGARELKKLSA